VNACIETSSLRRRFGQVVAVDGIDLCVPSGVVYGFLGANGAGKSTTIRLLLGLIAPDEGSISLFGQRLNDAREAGLARVGALVEAPSLYSHLTGRENLRVTARLICASDAQIGRALRLVRLEAAADRSVSGYSSGMRQRLGLALALLKEPALLILDEPANALDPAGIIEIRDLIRSLSKNEGVTVFMSSHLLSEVEQMADYLGVIHQGRLRFQGPILELRAKQRISVVVDVDSPERACEVLRAKGWSVEHAGPRLRVLPDQAADVDVAAINALLAGAGIGVTHLSLDAPSLEAVFLGLTQTDQLHADQPR